MNLREERELLNYKDDNIIITEGESKMDKTKGKVIDFNNIEDTFDAMVEEQAKKCREDQDDANSKKDAINILTKFKNYITSAKFNIKCMYEAKANGTSYQIVKNGYVGKILGKIADILGLVIDITGEVIMYAVKFLTMLINSVVDLATTVVKKIISLFTLNCGETCNNNN